MVCRLTDIKGETMIRKIGNLWIIDTKNTTYAFSLMETGQLEHLHYGERLFIEEEKQAECLKEKHAYQPGNVVVYDKEHQSYTLEDSLLEISGYGKGDIREPFVELTFADGSRTCDFVLESSKIRTNKEPMKTLPCSYGEGVEELVIHLRDKNYPVKLDLYYSAFEECDVITRRAVLRNEGEHSIRVDRLLSTQLDFPTDEYSMTTFHGAWAREMEKTQTRVRAGKFVNSTMAGCSSSRSNPFVMLSKDGTTEDYGVCYGLNLIYSGNHYEALEVCGQHKSRYVAGMNPQQFAYTLCEGEELESPEAVMTYADAGFNAMSQNMHHFVKEHIVRGVWKNKERPILLNSWEAAYFDINERNLLRLAKEAKDVGIELFVVDDGWFGERMNDTKSLGDWIENTKKLPNGLKGLGDKVKALGIDFGIWIEPEMVNVDSELYRNHEDWVMQIRQDNHSEGRNQRILDLCNPKVCDYIIKAVSDILEKAPVSYVKWDMNRIFSDYYSPYLAKIKAGNLDIQSETGHRYMIALYGIMKTLTERFPEVLFEGCASGGNRFDLGILCYFPQIWASDNTDAISRVRIQTSYSYGYPMSCVGAHVSSCPNHQTLRVTPLETRYAVASFGVLGYECNLCDCKKEELEEIRRQIAQYKQWRNVLQFGDFYRGVEGNQHQWTCVAQDKSKAVGMMLQELVEPNTQAHIFYAKGLAEEKKYHFYNLPTKYNIKEFGDLVNTVSPIHIRQDSMIHNVLSKFVTMPGEVENVTSYGKTLMAGVKLKQAFSATGYNEETRFYQDYSSRLYYIEEEQ